MRAGHIQHIAPSKFRFVPHNWRADAARLQRKGLTLTEIAVELGVPRKDVERVLYWEAVQ